MQKTPSRESFAFGVHDKLNTMKSSVIPFTIVLFLIFGLSSAAALWAKKTETPSQVSTNPDIAVTDAKIKFETINGIEVPPEPDPELNNATLAGIDVNGNGVRDDLEREIAKKFGKNTGKYTEALAFIKAEEMTIVLQTKESVQIYGKAVDCTTMLADELDPITFIHLNTNERGQAYALANAGASGGQRDDCEGWEDEILN